VHMIDKHDFSFIIHFIYFVQTPHKIESSQYAFLTCNSVVILLSSIHKRLLEMIAVTVWSSKSQICWSKTSCHM
jgi:hypothetical protein